MKIQILDSHLIDQIAAGEVVERPAHLVKEIVENAIDAGARNLEIQFEQGGRWVKVMDDGIGMSAEDLKLVFHRHATSKIHAPEDLWNLSSFGFRGEAMASIGSVSRVTLVSRQPESKSAFQIQCNFGQLSEVSFCGGDTGTTVLVEELFDNVPARRKFLKSDTAEASQIKNMIKALALSHPEVGFTVRSGGKLLFYWGPTEGRRQRCEQVLEKTPLFSSLAVVGNVRAEVVLTAPNDTVRSSRHIWTFVQNRWVQDRSIQAALMDGYRSLLMHGEFPIAAIWVQCPADSVDVNVHPTKSQVKFQNSSDVFRAVLRATRQVLEDAPWLEALLPVSPLPKLVCAPHTDIEKLVSPPIPQESLRFVDQELEQIQYQKKYLLASQVEEAVKNYAVSPQAQTFKERQYFKSQPWKPPGTSEFQTETNAPVNGSPEEYAIDVKIDSWPSEEVQSSTDTTGPGSIPKQRRWSLLQVIGQADLTYIVCQSDQAVIFIDMHAAHERVAYERLMQSWHAGHFEIQPYLVPLTIDLDASLIEALQSVRDDLFKMGIKVEFSGDETVQVMEAPLIIKERALANAMEMLAREVMEHAGSFAMEKKISDICATMACHSVVRKGQALSKEQMQQLLIEMDDFPHSNFCPHGRPVFVEYKFGDIEKDFGRII